MDFSGRLGGSHGSGARRDVDEFGRERRNRPHHRKPYERPTRGFRGGRPSMGGRGGPPDEAKEIESRLSSLIIKVGDKNTPTLQNNLDALSVVLEKDFTKHEATVLKTLRQCVLELPWKVTVYSTLAGLLNAKNSETGAKVVALMHAVLRRELSAGNWGSVKVLVRFFALLVDANAISATMLLAILDAFLKPVVSDNGAEIVVSAQNSCYVFIVASALLWGGRALKQHAPEELAARLQTIERYVQRHSELNQDNALAAVFHDAQPKGTNILAYQLGVLREVAEAEWKIDAVFVPNGMFASELGQATQHEVPALELPTGLRSDSYYTPCEFLQLVPSPAELAVRRYVLQDLIADTISQLEGNRKDCAKYLMQVHGLCGEDVCSIMTAAQHPEDVDPETSLVFEYMMVEVLFTSLMQLPEGPYREMYYSSLAIELRKAEPQILANVFETAVENIVARISSFDVECINRLSNWLAVYLGNFGFQWDWTKWEGAAEEAESSPRRRFVEETLLKLIRLSYLDRIKTQLPESCLSLVPSKTPAHNFKFTVQSMDERTREVSVAMGRCLKNKGTADQAMEILQTHYSQWSDIDEETRQGLAREMLVEHVLLLGSKTFSHMLNAIEKFMPALQRFGDSPEAKLQIAKVVEDFWLKNPQFCAITIDKLVNYRVIDPTTVVAMLFDASHVGRWCMFHLWEILRNTVNKVNMRVVQLQGRLNAAQAAANAIVVDDAEPSDPQQQQKQQGESVEHVESVLEQMLLEQREVVVLTTQRFVQLLSASDGTADELDRAWLMGRFKEFMRSYRVQIVANAQALENQVFTADASQDTRQVFENTRMLST
ncbi:Nuclear cap-binding protein subunit 1 [Coemansia guatemalensis]|uniref:Nuclear cap-binding protein subunit 1 n=1 Tax=Coemansia guatemalensis TaxID=2761395 RepID=A0A9W8HVI1_9FUNG|nr:Nuclear cap-binding protein subunit 1 [Coemansia guatemalensis]